jgi:adenosylhomocysteine nucleosidase
LKILTVVPTRIELNAFLKAFQAQGYRPESSITGRHQVTYFPDLEMTVALGGLGSQQFALRTQQLIDAGHGDLVICAGTAGALVAGLAKGDVVISTESVEYAIRDNNAPSLLPRYRTPDEILQLFHQTLPAAPGFHVHYGPIATTDDFFMWKNQRARLQNQTGALVVAMEGTGGARACHDRGRPFVEIRAVTDHANLLSLLNFLLNLNKTMSNLAQIAIGLARSKSDHNLAG